jgi:hypothetical protein
MRGIENLNTEYKRTYTPLEACIYARNSLSGSMTVQQHRKTVEVLLNAIENAKTCVCDEHTKCMYHDNNMKEV